MSRAAAFLIVALAVLAGRAAATFLGPSPHEAGAHDMKWPLCYARQLLHGEDPYGPACQFQDWFGRSTPANPLTAAVVLIPFAPLNPAVAATLIVELEFGLLTWAILRRGGLGQLVVLASLPSVAAVAYAQWSPLLLAVALLPRLLPLTLVKPHIGLPIAITHMTRWRALACILFLGMTLILDPTWPLRWLPLTRNYGGQVPLMTPPGAVVLFTGLLCWRDRDARYLLLCAAMPQRLYDVLVLAATVRTPYEAKVWAAGSWLVFVAFFIQAPFSDWLAVAALYLPTCGLLLARRRAAGGPLNP